MSSNRTMDYRSAGVDLERAESEKRGFRSLLAATKDRLTLSDLGVFGGLYAVPDDVPDPVLVSSADGVGTKLRVAFLSGRHGSVGQDIVNHCVNDILVQGARPLFFMDYLATGRLEEGIVHQVVEGVAAACQANQCALLGGETAQMPGFYADGEYDLAGFIVGIVSRGDILSGADAQPGDALIGLPSSGLHTNGYSLARRILFDTAGLKVDDAFPRLDETVAEVLLRVHRSYLMTLTPEIRRGSLLGLAHITGGGLPGNIPRSLPDGLGARILKESWEVPQPFEVLRELGGVEESEMYRAFNMGVGMVAIVSADQAAGVVARLRESGEDAWELGEVVEGAGVRLV